MRLTAYLYSLFLLCHGCTILSAKAQSVISSPNLLHTWLETEGLNWEDEVDSSFISNHLSGKLDLNRVDPRQLDSIGVLTSFQIESFCQYRKSFGIFVDLYELQAIPGWDIGTLRRVAKWFTLIPLEWYEQPLFGKRSYQSTLSLRWRLSGQQEQNNTSAASSWLGDRHSLQALYRYNSQQIKIGITAEKDPGEYWITRNTKILTDFVSAYVSIIGKGVMRQITIGDFTVNMAQGLIQWQSMNFRKTPVLPMLKKSKPVFQPHRSVNEFNFHRGIAIELVQKNHSFSLFTSWRGLSANFGFSSIADLAGITSFHTSGYHRTETEIAKKNNATQFACGGRYAFRKEVFSAGLNFISYQFSAPLITTYRSYDQFGIMGRKWINASVDFSFTYRNWHLFLEQATDKKGSLAGIAGLLYSVSKQIDIGCLGRVYSRAYQSLYSNAIAEGSQPSNEEGVFWAINIRLSPTLQFQLFADYFHFPWLRYLIDQPSRGLERFFQFNYQPDKDHLFYLRIREEQKLQTISDIISSGPLSPAAPYNRIQLRLHFEKEVSKNIKMTFRVETTRVVELSAESLNKKRGYLSYVQFNRKTNPGNNLVLLRFLIFDTDSYQSRVYAFTPAGGGTFTLGQYQKRGYDLLLSIENHSIRVVTARVNFQYTTTRSPALKNQLVSLQIALKFHELASSKIYRPI